MIDAASEEYLQKLGDRILQAFDGNVTGIYLHGSAVLGGYNSDRSDLDVLVVVPKPMTEAQRAATAKTLSDEALPCPATGLEMSIVTEAVAANPDVAAPPFELHMTTAATDSKIVDGRDHEGDPDLVLHFAVCREKGENLARHPAKSSLEDVFGAVPRRRITAQLRQELGWAEAPRHYAVLNASRAWMYAVTRQLVSKVTGGAWALRRMQSDDEMTDQGGRMALIRAALAKQTGDEAAPMEADDVQRYVDFVLHILDQDGNGDRSD